MPTAITPVRNELEPLTCKAPAPVFNVDLVSALTFTLAFLPTAEPENSFTVVSFKPAVVFLLISASAKTIWAPTFVSRAIPIPAATVVALEVSVAAVLITGSCAF